MSGSRLQKTTLVILALGITLLFLWMIRRFIMPLLLGAILAGLFHPLYRWMERHFRGRKKLASAATLLLVMLLFVLPVTGFLGLVTAQAYQLAQTARPWVETQLGRSTEFQRILEALPFYNYVRPYQDQILAKVGSFASLVGTFAMGSLAAFAVGTASFLLSLFVMLYAMFFFFVDGGRILHRILYLLPLPAEDEEQMVGRFVSVTRATIKGTLIIGVVQGALAGLAFWVAGVQGAAFWAATMAILSVIPGLGAALVWVPAVIYLLVIGRWEAGLALLIWSAAVVSSVDNLLRPRLVGRDTQMPDLLILLSTLGGLIVFGASGFVLGPILAALLLTIWDLYTIAFKDILPPAWAPSDGPANK
ncbi:MAG TPA: AI-2E family transporter [Anaerolineales bacterium]|nr:AI-2E family transporter [Anaerolineales bacterium]